MQKYIGTATSRLDGRAKVTGEAKYAAEYAAPESRAASRNVPFPLFSQSRFASPSFAT